MIFGPRKHVFAKPADRSEEDLIPPWLQSCRHCGKDSGLSLWQLADMPRDMALCESPRAPRMSLGEWFFGGIDCTEKPAGLIRRLLALGTRFARS